jgi:hypothetical protein
MQDWKIKRMSVKRLLKWIDAISRLLSHYLGIHKLDWLDCPICFLWCSDCLWKIIEETDCQDSCDMIYPDQAHLVPSILRRNPDKYKKWKKIRISQLMNWEKIMTLELERRKSEKRKKGKS